MSDLSTVPPGQSSPGTPPPGQQAPVEPQPAPQPVIITGNEPPAPPPPPQPNADGPTAEQFAQLQQQAAQAQQQLAQATESARHFQSQASQLQNVVRAYGGQPPQPPQPQDPVAPYVQKLVQQGYKVEDARAIATTQYEMTQQFVAPLQQQLQQTQASAMASQTVEPVMQQLYAQRPDLFQNASVYEQTRQGLIAQAAQGGKVDVVQAAMTAAALSMQASFQQPPQGQQFPPMPQYQPQAPQFQPGQPIPQPFANGQFRVMPNFQQQAPQTTALPADAQQVDADMRSYFKLPPKTA